MGKHRKDAETVEAIQWFKQGDHEAVVQTTTAHLMCSLPCPSCGTRIAHGFLDIVKNGTIVCPGDWIITNGKGEHSLCKRDVFNETYELIKE